MGSAVVEWVLWGNNMGLELGANDGFPVGKLAWGADLPKAGENVRCLTPYKDQYERVKDLGW